MAFGAGPIPTENQFPCRTLVACLSQRTALPPSHCAARGAGGTCEQAGLRRAHGAGARVLPVLRGRGVPEVRQHVDDLVVHLEGRGVDGLVRQVDLHPHHRHALLLRLEDDVDVGRSIQPEGARGGGLSVVVGEGGGGQGCIGREGTSEGAPEAAKQAVEGGYQSGWGRLLSVTNATETGTCRQEDSGWA